MNNACNLQFAFDVAWGRSYKLVRMKSVEHVSSNQSRGRKPSHKFENAFSRDANSKHDDYQKYSTMDIRSDGDLQMYFYANRLKTFEGWPFDEDCACTPENMAKAGFIHTPSENSPDIAMCFFCLKELEGWEPDDDPEKEHKSHSPSCHFISLKKKTEDITVEEFFKLQKERRKFIITKTCNEAINKFEEASKKRRADIIKTAMGEE